MNDIEAEKSAYTFIQVLSFGVMLFIMWIYFVDGPGMKHLAELLKVPDRTYRPLPDPPALEPPPLESVKSNRPVITPLALILGWVLGLLTLLVPLYLSWHFKQLTWLLPSK